MVSRLFFELRLLSKAASTNLYVFMLPLDQGCPIYSTGSVDRLHASSATYRGYYDIILPKQYLKYYFGITGNSSLTFVYFLQHCCSAATAASLFGFSLVGSTSRQLFLAKTSS